MRHYILATLSLGLLLGSCNGESARIDGRFTGVDKETVYLEIITPANMTVVDSARTDKKGNFKFVVKLPDGQPTLYNIGHKGRIIPVLLSPGDKLSVCSISGISLNYTVEGSEGSARVREVNQILTSGAMSLDSVRNAHSGHFENREDRARMIKDFTDIYYRTKRAHIKFIVENAGSIAGIYALHQRMPGDDVLFNGEGDIVYYRMVADSVEKTYPDSPYLIALKKQLASIDNNAEIRNKLLSEPLAEVGFPDLDLPDMYGKKQKLTDFKGKVILVDFWSMAMQGSTILNAELRQAYRSVDSPDFVIYQVSVDRDKAVWVNSVLQQKLPWISVNDLKGIDSPAVRSYNVTSVPANFLIDKNGNIVAKNLFGEDLVKKVKQLVK